MEFRYCGYQVLVVNEQAVYIAVLAIWYNFLYIFLKTHCCFLENALVFLSSILNKTDLLKNNLFFEYKPLNAPLLLDYGGKWIQSRL